MTTYRMTILVEVDEAALSDHDGNATPPPNDVTEWYGGDLVAAVNAGIAEIVHDEIEGIEEVSA